MNIFWIIGFVLVILALAGAPGLGPWNHGWGFYPSGGLSTVIVVLVILLLLGKI